MAPTVNDAVWPHDFPGGVGGLGADVVGEPSGCGRPHLGCCPVDGGAGGGPVEIGVTRADTTGDAMLLVGDGFAVRDISQLGQRGLGGGCNNDGLGVVDDVELVPRLADGYPGQTRSNTRP